MFTRWERKSKKKTEIEWYLTNKQHMFQFKVRWLLDRAWNLFLFRNGRRKTPFDKSLWPVLGTRLFTSKAFQCYLIQGFLKGTLMQIWKSANIFCFSLSSVISSVFLMFLHHVNNIEHDTKQNTYIGMEVISFIPPW